MNIRFVSAPRGKKTRTATRRSRRYGWRISTVACSVSHTHPKKEKKDTLSENPVLLGTAWEGKTRSAARHYERYGLFRYEVRLTLSHLRLQSSERPFSNKGASRVRCAGLSVEIHTTHTQFRKAF